MATDRLKLYNQALIDCGERILSSLTENREARYDLDAVWDNDGVKACLEAGQWKFAMRTVQVDYDTAVTPPFGYIRAFTKPSDWCVTSSLCSDEYFNVPLTRYEDEAGYWYADLDTIYVRYVSNDTNYGMDFGKWPANFTLFVAAYFAEKIVRKLTGSADRHKEVRDLLKDRKLTAKSTDAMADPTRFPAPGGWVSSRHRGGRASRDRGNSGSLIG